MRALFKGDIHAPNDAADYLRGDWVRANRASGSVSNEKIQDAFGELGNVLFGGYLTAIYSRCTMATFQELPVVRMPDRNQSLLRTALEYYSSKAERAFLVEVSCSIGDHPVHFWLVMMARPSGFRAMLETLKQS